MKPRIAYDVSFCADLHSDQKHVTGIGRVVENIADILKYSDDFELCMIGCHGGDERPALTDARTYAYWKDRWAPRPPVMAGTVSRFGLRSLYAQSLAGVNRPDAPRSFTSKLFNTLSRLDAAPRPLDGKIALFHSPFRPLPEHGQFRGPMVLTVHDLFPLEEPAGSYNRRMLEQTLALADPARTWVLSVSEYTRRELIKVSAIPAERVIVMPLAAESLFRPTGDGDARKAFLRRHGIPDAPYFLSVANPQPRKNIPHLIRCFQEFAKTEKEHQLVLVGSRKLGWNHSEIDREIEKAPELRQRIHFTGAASDEELAVAYSNCTAFLFPSQEEGFGLPPLEAMQCGAPVVSSNTTSLPEVTGNAAILVPPDDECGLVQAMQSLVSRRELREDLREKSLARARGFSWEKTAQIVTDTYRQALASKRS
ncbi:glycosyltransferase [Terrimicrobium sacchariphilum]|uniref:Glycosyltransferase n=1 Tax=Terrimicrobium sacchariphilum TaxID=690879 RepID=A0A146GDH9_TERSA|nr:glycosyltransferase family 1 protein [Terrimicrobium sacchariphilum]GAT35370.1 glycosyltransferase [Terrimicrobium sacchariphilum]